jgi:phosphoglycerol transferase
MGKKKRNKSAQAGGSGAVATEIRQVSTPRTQVYSAAQAAKPSFFTGAVFEWLAIVATSLLAVWFLTARVVGVQVSVLADEYLYLLDAHYKGLDQAAYPNYLFQWIYGSTKLCGAEFYSCARSINSFFVIFGAIFIYLLAKHIGRSKWLGALAAVAAILGSYGTYTAYFMPEAIFNGLMVVFFWALIRFGKSDNLLVWVAIGISLGIASLAKPHGLFVIPAIVIFVILWTRATKDRWLIPAVIRSSVFVGSVVVSKLLFGYLLAGERGLGLFGFYGTLESVGSNTVAVLTSDGSAGTSVWFTAWGQTLMISMILGLALPVAMHGIVLAFKKASWSFDSIKFRALVGISLLNLLAVTAIFESWQNLGIWMHTRYYAYLIPLAIIALIESFRKDELRFWPWGKYFVTGVFLALSGVLFFTAAMPYGTNWVDAPDFRYHIDNPLVSQFFVVAAFGSAIWWLFREKASVRFSLGLALMFASLSGANSSAFLSTAFGSEQVSDRVAVVLREFIPQSELDRALLVGNFEVLQRTAFSSLSGSIELMGLGEEGLDTSTIDSSKSWLIMFGDSALSDLGKPTIIGLGYQMYSLDPSNSLRPRNGELYNTSNACDSNEESAWSCGDNATLRLDRGFPANARVDMIIEISEEAAANEIEFILGDSTVFWSLPAGISSLNLRFENSFPVQELKMRVSGKPETNQDESNRFVRVIWALDQR